MSISRQVRRQAERLAAKNPGRIIKHRVRRADLHPLPTRTPEEIEARAALKGRFDGTCNRTACQEPIAGANWFNTSTRAYYCTRCARDINHWSMRDEGVEILCHVVDPADQPPFPYERIREIRDNRLIRNINQR